MSAASEFSNVTRPAWHRSGVLAGQTAYVTLAFVLITLFVALFAGNFTTAANLLNISRNFSFIGIMSLGMTVVIITGGIDLSVGSVCALVAVCTVIVMRAMVGSALAEIPFATLIAPILFGLGLAAFLGAINGVLIARVGLSPFVTTLGMLSICRGLTYVITQGRGQTPAGPDVHAFYAVTNGTIGGVPIEGIYMLVAALILGLALRHSVWGRHLFALGGSETAAMRTGVRVARMKIGAYVLCSLAGGVGGPTGAVIGAALIEVIRNGLVLGRVDPYWQDAMIGLIIILAVLVDKLRTRQSK